MIIIDARIYDDGDHGVVSRCHIPCIRELHHRRGPLQAVEGIVWYRGREECPVRGTRDMSTDLCFHAAKLCFATEIFPSGIFGWLVGRKGEGADGFAWCTFAKEQRPASQLLRKERVTGLYLFEFAINRRERARSFGGPYDGARKDKLFFSVRSSHVCKEPAHNKEQRGKADS